VRIQEEGRRKKTEYRREREEKGEKGTLFYCRKREEKGTLFCCRGEEWVREEKGTVPCRTDPGGRERDTLLLQGRKEEKGTLFCCRGGRERELWRAKGENSGGRKKKEDRIQKRKGRERDTLLLQEEKGKRKGHSFAAGENG